MMNLKDYADVRDWNAAHQVGTDVTVRTSKTSVIAARTESEAWVSPRGAVIMVAGATRALSSVRAIVQRTEDGGQRTETEGEAA